MKSEIMTFILVALLAAFLWLQNSEPVAAYSQADTAKIIAIIEASDDDYLTQLQRAGAL